ncbi:MAG TPA: hypothetical protein VM734_10930 [Kofleriaceae bacterium]|jgi:hypothetical protein|nr:hypothetical protein [Kofleriaceae bacterium]
MAAMPKAILILVVGAALAACGPKGKPPEDPLPGDDDGAAPKRTEIEVRRDAACEALGPKITACALEDARRTMSPEELAQLDPEQVGPVHTREFIKDCKQRQLSSRQVRVYEVCMREETACEPLLACLENATPTAPAAE